MKTKTLFLLTIALLAPLAARAQQATQTAPQAPTGCDASPVKKPRFHIPKAVQDAVKKQAKQLSSKTGVDVDPDAPAQAVKDAQQKLPPCPPAAKPANK